ncbi:MAG: zinc ribbon domain-containing protein [Deltaproteobacteria bacterium]|nr:zinc ribbon domain-containing protein [Deltaproteobacteria bacterium]
MPIYEFKCRDCDKYIEILVINKDEEIEMKCSDCGSMNLERILSSTSHVMGIGPAEGRGATAKTRNCSSGSCTTYDIPGYSR